MKERGILDWRFQILDFRFQSAGVRFGEVFTGRVGWFNLISAI